MPRPQFVSCPLCHQGFGQASINIHIPQCYDKALKRWKLTRDGPHPVMPALVDTASLPSSRRASLSPSRRGSKGTGAPSGERPAGSSVSAARAIKRNSVSSGALAPVDNGVLKSCAKCGRTFSEDRIAYHESVCVAGTHRPSFDSRRQRAVSVDEAMGFEYSAQPPKRRKQRRGGSMGGYTNESDPSRIPQTNWREAHEDLIAAVRHARRQSVGSGARPAMRSEPRQPTVGAPTRPTPRNDNADKILVMNPTSAQVTPKPPLKKATVPPSMARYNQTLKEKQQQPPRRTSTVEALGQGRRRSINEVVNYATGASKGSSAGYDGPRYIVNDNTSSIGMLQAFGQA